jgi:hypothetical protein
MRRGPAICSILAHVPYNERKLRVERIYLEASFHAAYRYWNLRGVLAERWAHGPYFGGYREGADQVVLLPGPAEDHGLRIQGLYGLRTASFNAEGTEATHLAAELAEKWFRDVYDVLAPRRTTLLRAQIFGLYPVKDPLRVSGRLRARFYNDEHLRTMVPSRFNDYHAAVEFLALDPDPRLSAVVGVVGPPHRHDGFFAIADPERDDSWWLGFRMASVDAREDDGFDDPVGTLLGMLGAAQNDFSTLARAVLPTVAE